MSGLSTGSILSLHEISFNFICMRNLKYSIYFDRIRFDVIQFIFLKTISQHKLVSTIYPLCTVCTMKCGLMKIDTGRQHISSTRRERQSNESMKPTKN